MIEGDSLDDIKLTREAGEAVGWYTITFDKLSTNGNYNITYRDGMFFIISEPDPEWKRHAIRSAGSTARTSLKADSSWTWSGG